MIDKEGLDTQTYEDIYFKVMGKCISNRENSTNEEEEECKGWEKEKEEQLLKNMYISKGCIIQLFAFLFSCFMVLWL